MNKKQSNVNKRRKELSPRSVDTTRGPMAAYTSPIQQPPSTPETKWKLAVTFLLTLIVVLSVALANKHLTPQDFGQKSTLGELFCGKDGKLYAKVFSQDTSTSPRGFRVEPIKKNNRKQYICVNINNKIIIK